ncbi:AAA family ATPase [Paraburkholderia domus]|uniref:AAA family ATPase n=1 Tax=Paraburkholderia domus TaxID=2793075 RepID=UPI0019143BDC|nr:AAA family ATPase [Paraburkholderia domus]MBK5185956.1 AAA family ATPase [Burkholderia sp. R-69749]CAE6888006.1 hypothetical protein R69749_07438 [Paraburkholderia domus]
MLKQVIAIRGVGLFHDAGPSPSLGRVSLIYGENGRGKSTLASVLRSCGDSQGTALGARKTLDGTLAQSVQLVFADGAGACSVVQLANDTWSQPMPDLQVFDADFISRNVYSGVDIKPDQRANLLEFALGDAAVGLRSKVDEATALITDATTKINVQTAILKARAGQMTVEAFSALAEAPTADEEIAIIERRITAANARDEVLKKKVPALLPVPTFSAANLFTIMGKSLPEVEAAAEQAVRAHLVKCSSPGLENWVSQGGTFEMGDDCPYCGADILDNALIKAYRAHFNQAYAALKTEVTTLEDGLQRRLGDPVVDTVVRTVETTQAHADGWKGYVDKPPIAFDAAGMKATLSELIALLGPLAQAKARQPLESVGSPAQCAQAKKLWASAVAYVTTVNEQISEVVDAIETYKKALVAEDVVALRKTIDTLKLRQLRHTPAVVTEVEQLKQLSDAKKARADEKETARKALDTLMTSTLEKYQVEINTLLAAFGAQTRIENLSYDYRGSGLPRTEYRLQVRGETVKLTGADGAAFGNALSEGDKRALAFAFFVARLHQDPGLSDRIVVIDDPMCSLDRRRRAATIRVLKVLASKCAQLIVLAHDAYFLQALDDELRKLPSFKPVGALSHCKITPAANDYSVFGPLDLANECATQYETDLLLIMGYVDVKPGLDRDHVATRLRVLLEANLHRQFPSHIPRGAMLGEVITHIEKAALPSPLVVLHSSVPELRALNDYAKGFHHADDGTPPDFSSLDEGELRSYCGRALTFVLRGA